MTQVITRIVKLAVRRDPTVPIGQPAPLHLECPCGHRLSLDAADRVVCYRCECGRVYDNHGWLVSQTEW